MPNYLRLETAKSFMRAKVSPLIGNGGFGIVSCAPKTAHTSFAALPTGWSYLSLKHSILCYRYFKNLHSISMDLVEQFPSFGQGLALADRVVSEHICFVFPAV